MSEIIKISQLPISEITTIAKAFAESGMFKDTQSAAQAIVKIQAGQEIGIPPFAAMSGIHIIQGKPTIGAGLIASRVKGCGKYDYKVIEQTETVCSIDFYQGKEKIGNSTFTIEDAKKAGTQNLNKFARNMLFARAISNGVKWYCPDVFSGPVYTPEEMGSEEPQPSRTVDIPHETVEELHAEEVPVYEQWEEMVNAQTHVESLGALWAQNKAMLLQPGNENLVALFTTRKKKLENEPA